MKSSHRYIFYVLGFACLFAACSDGGGESRGPILLGDSTTIVTETNQQYLSDYVSDIQVQAHEEETPVSKDTVTTAAKPTTESVKEEPATKQPDTHTTEGNGLHIAFKDLNVFIPGVTTRTYRTQNLQQANGATYEVIGGNINGNKLKLSGATVTRVSQRYSTAVIAENEQGKLLLDALSYTSDWTPVKGSNNIFPITGLDESRLDARNAGPAQIRDAVTRAAKNKRMNRQAIQKWEQSVRSVRNVHQSPLSVKLRSVIWKIEAKDAKGKSFQKQIRLDIPL